MPFQAFTGLAIVERMNNHRSTDYMTTYEERLHSFHTWPMDIKPLPAAMASAGLYHSNIDTDTVTCFSCNQEFPDWKKHDDPIQRHLQQSSVVPPCDWMDKVTNQPTQYTLPTPPATPPVSAPGSIPHKCTACQGTFPSSNKFHRHRRQHHENLRGLIGIPLKQSGGVSLGKLGRYRVTKPIKQRRKIGRRGNTDRILKTPI